MSTKFCYDISRLIIVILKEKFWVEASALIELNKLMVHNAAYMYVSTSCSSLHQGIDIIDA